MRILQKNIGGVYTGENLNRIALPMGGIGAGMVCLEGTGALSHLSLRHKPEVFHEMAGYAAICIKGVNGKRNIARVVEGQVPRWKVFGMPGSANGSGHLQYGLPRFEDASFEARFPFATIMLKDKALPVTAEIKGWSPLIPGDADNSSLPVFALEYTFKNSGKRTVDAIFSFHSHNFIRLNKNDDGACVKPVKGGFRFEQPQIKSEPASAGYATIICDAPGAKVDCGWFRGGWFDSATMNWNSVQAGKVISRKPHTSGEPSKGASIYVPLKLAGGQSKTVTLRFSWYVPVSDVRTGPNLEDGECCDGVCTCSGKSSGSAALPTYEPWYAGKFKSPAAVADYWSGNYKKLRKLSQTFSDCFYDTTLPPEVVESIAANLAILKSPTVLRQKDGRFWAYEGCCDGSGCCHGSCTHVWNYAQALPHLFPDMERSLRETEFNVSQDERGHQNFRTSLPIRPTDHKFHAAADGQLGGLMKLYREWRISGDTKWMLSLWKRARASLDYCINEWDPDHNGVLSEPHHNTYDIEFWGPDGMCTSFYLGALKAAIVMGCEAGEDVSFYEELLKKGREYLDKKLWNGEYYIQDIQWKGLKAGDPTKVQALHNSYSPEALKLLKKEGPRYQYGTGCLSDGILGDWIARVCGIGEVLDRKKAKRNLQSIFKYNFKRDLFEHSNPQRPTYAIGKDGGLLLCSWPLGNNPSLPFVYSDEVWTGIEYQVASHLMMEGEVEKGLKIVRAIRERYDGRDRNPFNEYECGHWYARAMSSYGMLQGLTGARYDAVEKILYLDPKIKGDWRAFISTETGFGTVGIKKGEPFIEVRHGKIKIQRIEYNA